jgi:hypothetical protein
VTLSLPAHRHFSVSAFTALQRLRQYTSEHGVDSVSAAAALSVIDATFAAADMEAGLSLDRLLSPETRFDDYPASLRVAIETLIAHHLPWWRPFFPAGRKPVLDALTDSERQLFSNAGLVDTVPTEAALEWWYRIQATVRGEKDASQSLQGGVAEILTLEHERARLKDLGIDLQPELSGFETNGLGYDVKSYDPGPFGPVARLIEVKSSKHTPPRLILTRGEWKAALQYGDAFLFHFWRLPTKHLKALTVSDMGAHIPDNRGAGSWLEVEVAFP